jgi:hypothetical protein
LLVDGVVDTCITAVCMGSSHAGVDGDRPDTDSFESFEAS